MTVPTQQHRADETWSDFVSVPPVLRELHFGSRVVKCFRDRPKSLFDIFTYGLNDCNDGEAVIFGDRRVSYRELDEAISRAAGNLSALGIVKGDRVAILLPNCDWYIIILFAIAKIGAVIVPLNIREAAPELEHILNDSGSKLVVLEPSLAQSLPPKESTPHLLARVEIMEIASPAPADRVVHPVAVDEEDVAVILYTSGTTGRPKGAMLTHLNIAHSVLHYQVAMQITAADRSILAVPISHVTGLVALVGAIIGAGGTLIIMAGFKADEFLQLAEHERMTHTLIVPAMFNLCLLQPRIHDADLSAWRVAGYGGAIMPEVTLEKISRHLPQLSLINAYGATETTSPAVLMPPSFATDRADQVGLPVPCAEIFVMDSSGCEVPRGEAGEIWIGGPMVAKGYWNNPEATATEFVGGFWRSGDVGSQDELGFVRVIDRLKDVINRGGYKIYASEVENVLLDYPGILEVAVVADPCPVLGERVHAYVVAQGQPDFAALAEHCAKMLAGYKVPEHFILTEALPRNANGKVLKRQLRQG